MDTSQTFEGIFFSSCIIFRMFLNQNSEKNIPYGCKGGVSMLIQLQPSFSKNNKSILSHSKSQSMPELS